MFTHPFGHGNLKTGMCSWTAGAGRYCGLPADASVHQRERVHPYVERRDGRCGHEVGDGVLCGMSNLLPVHAS